MIEYFKHLDFIKYFLKEVKERTWKITEYSTKEYKESSFEVTVIFGLFILPKLQNVLTVYPDNAPDKSLIKYITRSKIINQNRIYC